MREPTAITRQRPSAPLSAASRAFTLTELMVAVVVLIVVIIATSKIFGTASQITGMGQATISVMQEAAAIERRLRDDLSRISTEGFMIIRCVAVRNDVRGGGQPLLNPSLPPNAIVRADQLMFFATGLESMSSAKLTQGTNVKPQGVATRVYYGHAFQLPQAQPATVISANTVQAHDPAMVGVTSSGAQQANLTFLSTMFPWHAGTVGMVTTPFTTVNEDTAQDGIFQPLAGNPASIDGTQPEARQWLLVRQPIVLANDDTDGPSSNRKTVYLFQGQTARSIYLHNAGAQHPIWGWTREVRNGRVDGAASVLSDIRAVVTHFVSVQNNVINLGQPRKWNDSSQLSASGGDQRRMISSACYYPRAERRAPSMHRVDQALTNCIIGSACSSFIVEWTYAPGTGAATNSGGGSFAGVAVNPVLQQPWFGLSDTTSLALVGLPPPLPGAPAPATYARGVGEYREDDYQVGMGVFAPPLPQQSVPHYAPAVTIPGVNQTSTNLERNNVTTAILPFGQLAANNRLAVYEALFGYNTAQPLQPNGAPWPDNVSGVTDQAYTPFPTAIRVTMVLHDPQGRMESGREFQFVIELPRRGN